MSKREFFSIYDINDEISFRPMWRHQEKFGIVDEMMEGKIVAVKFTEAKVFYDVFSPYWGMIFDNVDSAKVFDAGEFIIPKLPEQDLN